MVREVESGRLQRLYRGVYAVGYTPLTMQGRCLAAVLAGGPRALLSHHSAGWLLGISKHSPLPVHVTGPSRRSPRLPIVFHHSRCLAPEDAVVEQWIPVTSLPRTLLDLAAAVRFEALRRIVQRSEELRMFDLEPVEAMLDRTRGHHGWGRLRRAVALYRPVSFTRSEFERRFTAALVRAGLPRPANNFVEAGFELDVYWPELRFAVELDVYATHGTRGAFESDRLRQEDLKLAGIELTRVTDVRFDREPGAVIDRVSKLLEQRRRVS